LRQKTLVTQRASGVRPAGPIQPGQLFITGSIIQLPHRPLGQYLIDYGRLRLISSTRSNASSREAMPADVRKSWTRRY
jgi:hypothetical protein